MTNIFIWPQSFCVSLGVEQRAVISALLTQRLHLQYNPSANYNSQASTPVLLMRKPIPASISCALLMELQFKIWIFLNKMKGKKQRRDVNLILDINLSLLCFLLLTPQKLIPVVPSLSQRVMFSYLPSQVPLWDSRGSQLQTHHPPCCWLETVIHLPATI